MRALAEHVGGFNKVVATKDGDWVVKGFIDIAKNIYTISVDTKVVSKIIELLLFPELSQFAEANGYKMVLSREQNFYPDIAFVDDRDNKFALDIKSTYRKSATTVNGMTLGAFTGYFRKRDSAKNIIFPYAEFVGHFVLGVIYSQNEKVADERSVHPLEKLQEIASVVRNFEFFVQEKYRIATDRPGSGNTKNIGSVVKIDELLHGKGPFAKLGEEVFDDYWMYYLTKDMALAAELPAPPYHNLATYLEYKKGLRAKRKR